MTIRWRFPSVRLPRCGCRRSVPIALLAAVLLGSEGFAQTVPPAGDCPPGDRLPNGDCTACPSDRVYDGATGTCCWPGQRVEAGRCRGAPSVCPAGMSVAGEECRFGTAVQPDGPAFGEGPFLSIGLGAYGTGGVSWFDAASAAGAGAVARGTAFFLFELQLSVGGAAGRVTSDWVGVALGGSFGVDLVSWPPATSHRFSPLNLSAGVRVDGLIRTNGPGTFATLQPYLANTFYLGCPFAARLEFAYPIFNGDWFPPSATLSLLWLPLRFTPGDQGFGGCD